MENNNKIIIQMNRRLLKFVPELHEFSSIMKNDFLNILRTYC